MLAIGNFLGHVGPRNQMWTNPLIISLMVGVQRLPRSMLMGLRLCCASGNMILRAGEGIFLHDVARAFKVERRIQETRGFVRQARAAARRKYTSEENIRIVLEGFSREIGVRDRCRPEGIKPGAFYAWTKDSLPNAPRGPLDCRSG